MIPKERLIVALDVPTVADAEHVIERLGDAVGFYKIGYQLVLAGGLTLCPALVSAGKKVFLDLKLHDIGITVAKSVESAAYLGATFLTVHGYPQTMRAAVKGRKGSNLQILAVTVLTSYDDVDMWDAGYGTSVKGLVRLRALQAQQFGIDGIVCSPHEAASNRHILSEMTLVCPGVRLSNTVDPRLEHGDQKRVMTPAEAIAAGADYLVIGRPILQSPDPLKVVASVVSTFPLP